MQVIFAFQHLINTGSIHSSVFLKVPVGLTIKRSKTQISHEVHRDVSVYNTLRMFSS